ncbi:hypothetical protein CL628_02120 [bacterium]|nr:hypothetical protein [bacterium]|tara:strand:- start:108 stop:557 length:450 start_codon:yes stop_codon:yes gene_type:complete
MLSIIHTFISLPFSIVLENPVLIFISAAVFHLFADSLLHWNIYPHEMKRFPALLIALDVVGGLAVAIVVFGSTAFTLPILVAIAGGNFPDALHTSWDLLPKRTTRRAPRWVKSAFAFHNGLQHETYDVARGLVWQIVLAVIALLVITLA